MKKIILLIAFSGLSFVFVNAQNGGTKPATTPATSQTTVAPEKTTPTKVDAKETKKENCTPEEKKNCGKKSKACCAHKSEAKS